MELGYTSKRKWQKNVLGTYVLEPELCCWMQKKNGPRLHLSCYGNIYKNTCKLFQIIHLKAEIRKKFPLKSSLTP